MEQPPASVPSAKQAGELKDQWSWTEPTVWTERMLGALFRGVKGGVWFSLMDKVFSLKNLNAAMNKVLANKGAAGVDHVRVEDFQANAIENLRSIEEQLRSGSYRPQAIRRINIPKPGTTEVRPLGIPTVRDRVVQKAVTNVIEPIFEKDFAECSYGFRPGRGAKQALARVEQLLKEGYEYVVDVDLKSYFDTIPHDRLIERLKAKVVDGKVLGLIESFLKANILEGLQEWNPSSGTPQGAVLSPLLSNIYLDPLDHLMSQQGSQMVRYADDLIILCRTKAEAQQALDRVREWVVENGLQLHPEKTKLVKVSEEPFEFLGFRYDRQRRYVRKKSLEKLKATVRAKTRRTDGRSLNCIIADLNRTLKGWRGYFQGCHETVSRILDGWIRKRLRSLLRKRQGFKGISRHGADENERWPKRFFAAEGLFNLKTATHT